MNRKRVAALFIFFVGASCLAQEEKIKLCQMDHRNHEAINYVGTRSSGGKAQLELLLLEGMQENDYVLEIGFGALMSAIPIMSFLENSERS